MKVGLLISLMFLISCGQDTNSQSNDRTEYGAVEIDITSPEGQRLSAAYAVLQTNCFSCHGGWSEYTTSNQWINAGKVEPGSYATSLLITRLKNNGGDMPPNPKGALPTADITVLQNWIDNL